MTNNNSNENENILPDVLADVIKNMNILPDAIIVDDPKLSSLLSRFYRDIFLLFHEDATDNNDENPVSE